MSLPLRELSWWLEAWIHSNTKNSVKPDKPTSVSNTVVYWMPDSSWSLVLFLMCSLEQATVGHDTVPCELS